MFLQGLSASYLTALADRILDGTVQPSDYGFATGSAGAGQVGACLAAFNGYFDPNSTGEATASNVCVLPNAGPAGTVPICPPGGYNANPMTLP